MNDPKVIFLVNCVLLGVVSQVGACHVVNRKTLRVKRDQHLGHVTANEQDRAYLAWPNRAAHPALGTSGKHCHLYVL